MAPFSRRNAASARSCSASPPGHGRQALAGDRALGRAEARLDAGDRGEQRPVDVRLGGDRGDAQREVVIDRAQLGQRRRARRVHVEADLRGRRQQPRAQRGQHGRRRGGRRDDHRRGLAGAGVRRRLLAAATGARVGRRARWPSGAVSGAGGRGGRRDLGRRRLGGRGRRRLGDRGRLDDRRRLDRRGHGGGRIGRRRCRIGTVVVSTGVVAVVVVSVVVVSVVVVSVVVVSVVVVSVIGRRGRPDRCSSSSRDRRRRRSPRSRASLRRVRPRRDRPRPVRQRQQSASRSCAPAGLRIRFAQPSPLLLRALRAVHADDSMSAASAGSELSVSPNRTISSATPFSAAARRARLYAA